jgi:hypothetical protein
MTTLIFVLLIAWHDPSGVWVLNQKRFATLALCQRAKDNLDYVFNHPAEGEPVRKLDAHMRCVPEGEVER